MTLAILPEPRVAFYEWGSGSGTRRENYIVLGVFAEASAPNHGLPQPPSGWLLCVREDGLATWMRLDQLTFEAAR